MLSLIARLLLLRDIFVSFSVVVKLRVTFTCFSLDFLSFIFLVILLVSLSLSAVLTQLVLKVLLHVVKILS